MTPSSLSRQFLEHRTRRTSSPAASSKTPAPCKVQRQNTSTDFLILSLPAAAAIRRRPSAQRNVWRVPAAQVLIRLLRTAQNSPRRSHLPDLHKADAPKKPSKPSCTRSPVAAPGGCQPPSLRRSARSPHTPGTFQAISCCTRARKAECLEE